MLKRFVTHMRFHTPQIGLYRSARLAAALTYGELRDRVAADYRRSRRRRLEFDRKYNVSTAERRFVADMVGAENQVQSADAIRYEPIEVVYVEDAISALEIDYSQFTLIDIGAGKGKVLFIAANYPFKKLIGVEFDQQLAATATKNVESYTNPDRKCHDMQIVNGDARQLELSDLPSVLYFYFPFRAPLLQEVLDQYGESLRRCFVIWTTLEDEEAVVLDACPHISRFAKTDESVVFRGVDLA